MQVDKLIHLPHIEDLPLIEGTKGRVLAEKILSQYIEELEGNIKKANIKLKFDGAPSFLFGTKDNKFFIAYKGALVSKNPVLFYNESDIDNYFTQEKYADLKKKYKYIFSVLKDYPFKFKGIYQGDLLYTLNDLIRFTSEQETYIGFQPNTLVYAFEENSDIAKKIVQSKLGIAVHTKYQSEDFTNLTFDFDMEKELPSTKDVVFFYPIIPSINQKSLFTSEEKNTLYENYLYPMIHLNFSNLLDIIDHTIKKDEVDEENIESSFLYLLKKYINDEFINQQSLLLKYSKFIKYLDKFKDMYIEKVKNKYKKPETIQNYVDKITNLISSIINMIESYELKNDIANFFSWYLNAIFIKNEIIKKLNSLSIGIRGVFTRDGNFIIAGEEGYVLKDIDGNVMKLVDRLQFTFFNFSESVKHAFTK